MGVKIKQTPLMRQYNEIKSKYPNTMLLFRVGDFYETFSEDAIKCSKILGIVLTRRANGSAAHVELAGFPHHSLDTYLPKLVQAGLRVAVCDQLEKPSKEKKLVKRGVTDIVTPGLTTNDKILNSNENNFLGALHFGKNNIGISIVDISTGEFYTFQGNTDQINQIINSYSPKEIIYEKEKENTFKAKFNFKCYTYFLDDWVFKKDFAKEKITKLFNIKNLKGFGIEEMDEATISSGAIIQYLENTNNTNLSHISKISKIVDGKYVWIDNFTALNLELYNSYNRDSTTLIDVLDKTNSSMGSRMMKRWLALPLKNVDEIYQRQNIVSFFYQEKRLLESIRENLNNIGDLERWVARISNNKISPKELNLLRESLKYSNEIKTILEKSNNPRLIKISDKLNLCREVEDDINETLNEEAPSLLSKGNVIKEGFNKDLDYYKNILFNSKSLLNEMLEREVKNTGIPSLKIGFNNVFGYYLEVTKVHKDKVPELWDRRQTLTNAERYITLELKKFEQEIFKAEEEIEQLENRLYYELIDRLKCNIESIQKNANIIANIDCLLSLSYVAIENNYHKPEVNNTDIIDIKNGRHPVIEKLLPSTEEYIPNNIFIDRGKEQILIITGPNMSGKSAFLRQTAIITIMAQIGGFVPAENSKIGVIDKIFSRVGASDNISSGESTFMVEMNETANILNNLTERSLIILDEIGRGTSTYDGISIAWSITEFLHECKEQPKVIFATHYHELNDMQEQFKRIKNYNISVKEIDNKIIFTRKLQEGGSEHSFGINVAEMAGIPNKVINRANEVLQILEDKKTDKIKIPENTNNQLNIFEVKDDKFIEIKDYLNNLNINNITPVEALIKLGELKNKLK